MFSLQAKLIALVMLAVFVAGVGWKGYRKGQEAVRLEWQADIAKRTAEALEASEKARQVEQELNRKVRNVQDAYRTARANTDHVAAAAAVGMRELEAILAKPSEPASSASATGRADDPRDTIIRECAGAVVTLGETVGRLQDKTGALQDYAAGVCLSDPAEKR